MQDRIVVAIGSARIGEPLNEARSVSSVPEAITCATARADEEVPEYITEEEILGVSLTRQEDRANDNGALDEFIVSIFYIDKGA